MQHWLVDVFVVAESDGAMGAAVLINYGRL